MMRLPRQITDRVHKVAADLALIEPSPTSPSTDSDTPNFSNCNCRLCLWRIGAGGEGRGFSLVGVGAGGRPPRPPRNTPKRVAQLCHKDISPDLAASHRYSHRSAVATSKLKPYFQRPPSGANFNSIYLLWAEQRKNRRGSQPLISQCKAFN